MSAIKQYRPELVLLAGALAGALVMPGCNSEPPLAEPPPVEVIVAQPVSEKIADWETYTGTLDDKDKQEIRARVRGEIKEVMFKEGQEVEAGKVLFRIDSDPFEADLKQAQGQQTTWKAKLKAAEEKIAIYQPLADKGTVAKEELVNALAAKGEALGGIETAKGKVSEAEINIAFCKIRSQVAGRVGTAQLTKGNLVNPSSKESLLTTVIPVDPVYAYFDVNEQALRNYQKILAEQFARTKKEAKQELPVEMALTGETNYGYKGTIAILDNKVDPNTSSIRVWARFANPKGPDGQRPLTPGMSARIRVTVAEPQAAILVPDRAILSDQSLKYVLVVDKAKDNVVKRVDITASERLQPDGRRAIESGLKGDEWIIIDGVNRVRPGVSVKAAEAAPRGAGK
jgi:RND family efflux transporter MFP subunit